MLHDPWGGGGETEDSLEEMIEDYKDRYNKKALIHPRFLGDESGSSEQETEKAIFRTEHEFSQIKLSLQNQIDSFILRLFWGNLSADLKEFTEILYQPESKYLSSPIFLFIEELLNQKPAEIRNTRNSLSSYICSTLELLETYDMMYDRFIPLEYVVSILKGEKDIDGCCDVIYESIYVKIQSQKCDHFSKNARNYRELRDSIMRSAGKMLTEIIGKGSRSARKTIIITPKDQGDTELKNTTMGVSRTTAVITKGRRDES